MTNAAELESAHLSRYDALLRISKTLAHHRTMAELFEVLTQHLHPIIPFDYLALLLHNDATDEMRLVVLEPRDIVLPFVSMAVAEQGPAATVWETQKAAVIPIPAEGPLQPVLSLIRSHGRKMTCWLPLTTAHRRVGVLSFGSRADTPYSDDVLAFMEQVAAAVAIAVDNGINWDQARHYQRELREERDRLRFLLEVNNLLVSHLDYAALLKEISDTVQRVVKHDHLSVALYDKDTDVLRLHWMYDNCTRRRAVGRLGSPRANGGRPGIPARHRQRLLTSGVGTSRNGQRRADARRRPPVHVLRAAGHATRQSGHAECRQRRPQCVLG